MSHPTGSTIRADNRRTIRPGCRLLVAVALIALCAGCATKIVNTCPDEPDLDALVESGARVMWIGAHPDDESFAGPLLAKAGVAEGAPLYFLVLTHGESGACYIESGCGDDLGAWRKREMEEVARLYGAELHMLDYPNVGFEGNGFQKSRDEIARDWIERGHPARAIAEAIREWKPDVVVTFAPEFGATGHPEHQLASRFAMEGARLAATPGVKLAGEPHAVGRFYWVLANYWPHRMLGKGDLFTPTEAFVSRQMCTENQTCAEVAAEYTKPHRSQDRDMGGMRFAQSVLFRLYFRRVDPNTENYPALEAGDGR